MKRFAFVAFVATVAFATPAVAAPITFTFDGTGTGSVGGTAFTDATFRITASGDTVGIFNDGLGFAVVQTSASITIAGIGAGVFTQGTEVGDNSENPVHSIPAVFFERGQCCGELEIFFVEDPAYGGYDLTTNLGPVFTASAFVRNPFFSAPLDIGPLVFTSVHDVTFTARVPEPTSLLLLGSGLLVLASRRIWRR